MPQPTIRRTLAAVLVTVALAGCWSKGQSGGEPGANTVELWTMQLKPTFADYMGDLIKRWETAHPGAHVNWVDLPSSDIESKTLTAAASGHAPDLVNLNPAFANRLAGAHALEPLQIDPPLRAQYFEAAWEANTVDGRVVGFPWYLSTSVTLYNTTLWKQAGLAVGQWPTTYRELAAAARQIKARTSALGFMPNFGDRGKFMEVLAAEGVPLLSADRQHAAFDTPQGVAVLSFWNDLLHDGLIPRESLTQGHREEIDRFQAGQTAAFPAGPQFLNVIRQNSPKLYAVIDVGPQIGGAGGKVGVAVMNLVIPTASTHKALAFDLARFITSGPNQLAFCKIVPILPSVKAAAADPFFRPTGGTLEERARAIAAQQLQRATLLVPPLPHQNQLAKALDDALQRASLGLATPADALKRAADDWDRVLAAP